MRTTSFPMSSAWSARTPKLGERAPDVKRIEIGPYRIAAMGYHGWRIAWALAVTQTVGYGVLYYAFAVFTLPMEAEFGLSRAQTSAAFSFGLLVAGLAAVPVGRWVDA